MPDGFTVLHQLLLTGRQCSLSSSSWNHASLGGVDNVAAYPGTANPGRWITVSVPVQQVPEHTTAHSKQKHPALPGLCRVLSEFPDINKREADVKLGPSPLQSPTAGEMKWMRLGKCLC